MQQQKVRLMRNQKTERKMSEQNKERNKKLYRGGGRGSWKEQKKGARKCKWSYGSLAQLLLVIFLKNSMMLAKIKM